ncbi:MAG: hypothetical protein NZ951_05045 [Dehalococcoidia bacterium]|nr:hypothetical protein [Dehalococcoidia bacterium]MDW8120662.1 hypothetical protein [Chloroflexota bacterium]
MGLFRVNATRENPRQAGLSIVVEGLLVDSGSAYTRVPGEALRPVGIEERKRDEAFRMADGHIIRCSPGYAVGGVAGFATVDEVVFAQPGDLWLLGACPLEGLGAVVAPVRKRLVPAGPLPVS